MAAEPRARRRRAEKSPAIPCPKHGVAACPKCCGGTTRSGKPCIQPKGWGTDHAGIGSCKIHGGSTPTHQAHAEAEKARRAVSEFAARRDVEPTEALLEVLGIRAGMVAFLTEQIAFMESTEQLVTIDSGGDEKPSVWVEMLDTALREYGRVAKACADAKIDERRIRIEESIGRQLSDVIRRVLEGVFSGLLELGVPGEVLEVFQVERVPAIVRASLASLVLRSPMAPAARA